MQAIPLSIDITYTCPLANDIEPKTRCVGDAVIEQVSVACVLNRIVTSLGLVTPMPEISNEVIVAGVKPVPIRL